ncbi:hypothetical protein D3C87_1971430 [compost metagenome]
MAQDLIQGSAVGQAGQRIRGGQLRQFLLGVMPQAQFPAEQPGQPEQAHAQGQGRQADHQRRALPRRIDFVAGQGNDDDQRQVAHLGERVQAFILVEA